MQQLLYYIHRTYRGLNERSPARRDACDRGQEGVLQQGRRTGPRRRGLHQAAGNEGFEVLRERALQLRWRILHAVPAYSIHITSYSCIVEYSMKIKEVLIVTVHSV